MDKMLAFHVDMNVGQFTRQYLEQWLCYLAGRGYNTIIWEIENNVAWETVPECVSPDAFSKDEFREILALSRELGLEPIPLLQTIGHAEYVLKHEPYVHLRERPDRTSQYCPRHPEVLPLLTRWIEEYIDLFGDIRRFHMGADEAYHLGECPQCSAFAGEHSLSRLYIDHINAISTPLRERGITPIIWCDMALKHPEAIEDLSRDITIFDWHYGIDLGSPTMQVWGRGRLRPEELDAPLKTRFGEFIFPEGEHKRFNIFYTTDYLQAQGFTTVTCPGSSSYGDNVFTPLESKHHPNAWDFGGKGLADASGTCLTSWSVHLHPWELQKACLDMPPYRAANPKASYNDFMRDFTKETFGVESPEFLEACLKLEVLSPWTYTKSLGYNKSCPPVPAGHILKDIDTLKTEGNLDDALAEARAGLDSYEDGRELMDALRKKATAGEDILDAWLLAADVLAHRARAAIHLLTRAQGAAEGDAATLVRECDALTERMRAAYTPIHRPTRREEMLAWMFASLRHALAEG